MGYHLKPKNTEIEPLYIGLMQWTFILNKTGAGYVIECGQGIEPNSFFCMKISDSIPYSNDGYVVTQSEALMMAQVAKGYLYVQKKVNQSWYDMPDGNEKKEKSNLPYRQLVNEDLLLIIQKFVDFAIKSDGFFIC